MSESQRIAKNAGIFFVADVVGYVLSFVFLIIITRLLGDFGFGLYSFAFAFVGFFWIIADLGLSRLAIREIARHKKQASKYLSNIETFKTIFSLATLAIFVGVVMALGFPREKTIVLILAGIAQLFYDLTIPFDSVYRAFERGGYVAIVRNLERVLMLIFGVGALMIDKTVMSLAIGVIIAKALVFFTGYVITYKRFAKIKLDFDTRMLKKLLKQSLPFCLTGIFMLIYFQVDTLMLSFMQNDQVVGWYNVPYRVVYFLRIIPFAIGLSFFPALSRYFVNNKKLLVTALEKGVKALVTIALPIGLGIMLLARRIVILFFGEQFINSILILEILIWAEVIVFLSYLFGMTLNSINKQHIFTISAGICVGLNVGLNLFLIPYFAHNGGIGAAIATALTETLNFVLLYIFVSRYVKRVSLEIYFLKPLLGCAVMLGAFYLLKEFNMAVIIILCAAAYFGTIYLLRHFDKDEIEIMKNAISPLKKMFKK